MNKLFTGFGKKTLPKKESIIIVSGLPRSGTSMMMKILAEPGVPIVTDELRRADTDNPNGYYELEAVKGMSAGNLAWLAGAGGRPGNLSGTDRRTARDRHPQPLTGSHATLRTAREKGGFKAGLR